MVKYPDVSIFLFKNLSESNIKLFDQDLKVTLSQKLIATYYTTQVEEYFNLAVSFYSLKECVDSLNDAENVDLNITPKLNLVERFVFNSPISFNHSYSQKIQWKKVFKREYFEFKNANKLLKILISASSISSISIHKFVDNHPVNLIKRVFFGLDDQGRKQFYKLLTGFPIQKEIEKYQKRIDDLGLDFNPTKLYRKLIFSDLVFFGKLNIDKGAAKALQRRWTNLLPVGITSVAGNFYPGDLVGIFNSDEILIAIGVTEYSSDDLIKTMGHSTSDFVELIGFFHSSNAIRRKNINF